MLWCNQASVTSSVDKTFCETLFRQNSLQILVLYTHVHTHAHARTKYNSGGAVGPHRSQWTQYFSTLEDLNTCIFRVISASLKNSYKLQPGCQDLVLKNQITGIWVLSFQAWDKGREQARKLAGKEQKPQHLPTLCYSPEKQGWLVPLCCLGPPISLVCRMNSAQHATHHPAGLSTCSFQLLEVELESFGVNGRKKNQVLLVLPKHLGLALVWNLTRASLYRQIPFNKVQSNG